ncbi:MAG: UDP-N-acetylmuramoyl-tripeptide--D-alanyl-D-alanine ligase [Planctomycetaceae bacterium]|nr:UDP-N-acetylmuramoyl-tripeptide--D-alanyl-D-alanine ligase [Planctomycetaceae bacterium]
MAADGKQVSGKGAFRVHCPSFQSLVIATRGEVLRRPAHDPVALSTDTRDDLAGACFVALKGENFDGHAFIAKAAAAGAVLAIVEQAPDAATSASLPDGFGVLRVASTRRALGAIAHAWRASLRTLRVVGVTGSAGKTTTRRLLEGILSAAGRTHASPKSFNNDIGVPLTLLSTADDTDFLVAEIGMNHPGEILPLAEMVEPEGAIITLAGRAHLEGLGSIEAVAKEKASILAGVSEHGFGIVNGDNPPLVEAVRALVDAGRAPRIVTFGTGPACAYRLATREQGEAGHRIEVVFPRRAAALDGDDLPAPISERTHAFTMRMLGEHNARNAVAAIAAAAEMGIAIDRIREGLAGVEASDMRLERLEIAGRTVYNDAYNANPDAMIASLRAFEELSAGASRRVVILGEMRELGPDARALHEEVGAHAGRLLRQRDALVAVGPHAEALVTAARAAGFSGESASSTAFSPPFAVDAAQLIPRGSVILLKGSRGARMERFLEPLEAAFAAAATGV